MKIIKSFIMMGLMGACCLFAGCGSLEDSKIDGQSEEVMGVVVGTFDDTWRTGVRNELYTMAEGKVQIDIWGANDSQKEQNEKIDELIKRKVKVLVVNLVSEEGAAPTIEKAKKADIPLVFFNFEPKPEDLKAWDKTYYVGAKAEQSGTMQGQILSDYFKNHQTKDGTVDYVLLKGPSDHKDAQLRSTYSEEAMQQNGLKIQKLAEDIALWKRELAEQELADILKEQGDRIDCVIANNDDMALGAIDALKDEGYFEGYKYIPVVGVDATSAAISAVKSKTLLGTVLNDGTSQGKIIYNLANVLMKGETPSKDNIGNEITDGKYIWVDYKIVTEQNVDEIK